MADTKNYKLVCQVVMDGRVLIERNVNMTLVGSGFLWRLLGNPVFSIDGFTQMLKEPDTLTIKLPITVKGEKEL